MDLQLAARFVEAVPTGFWTAYKDVATAAGNSRGAQRIGLWLRNSGGSIPNYWRVLRVDGHVPEAFHGGGNGPLDAVSARYRLRQEGVWVDTGGNALETQRFTVEDWIRLRNGGGIREVRLPKQQQGPTLSRAEQRARPGELMVGGTVRVREESGDERTWKIVEPDAAHRREGDLSARSVVAQALLGHVAGDMVVVDTRKGPRRIAILEVTS